MDELELIEAGEIVSTHGTRGEVRIYPWCDSAKFLCSFKTLYLDGKPLRASVRDHGTVAIAALEGIDDVRSAAALKGKVLCFARKDVKLPEGRYFVKDLIGLDALNAETGESIGRITDVLNMPAQDVWEITGEKKYLVPAVAAFVKETNVPGGYVKIAVIEGLEA